MGLLGNFEIPTSSVPRTCSSLWATVAYGANNRTWTCNLRITSALHYHCAMLANGGESGPWFHTNGLRNRYTTLLYYLAKWRGRQDLNLHTPKRSERISNPRQYHYAYIRIWRQGEVSIPIPSLVQSVFKTVLEAARDALPYSKVRARWCSALTVYCHFKACVSRFSLTLYIYYIKNFLKNQILISWLQVILFSNHFKNLIATLKLLHPMII